MKKQKKASATATVKVLTAKAMKKTKGFVKMSGKSGRNQAGCCG